MNKEQAGLKQNQGRLRTEKTQELEAKSPSELVTEQIRPWKRESVNWKIVSEQQKWKEQA